MLSALFGCRERKKRKRNDREFDGPATPEPTMITSASTSTTLADLHSPLAAAAAMAMQFTASVHASPVTFLFAMTKL